MKIEVLFPEFANLFGDCWNWKYLSRCMPEAELIETGYNDEPRFASEKVDMIIMGAMTEHGQELAIKKLMPHRDRLRELIDCGVVFLMTANAGEVFCEYIENEDGSRIAGLGLVPLHAKRDMMHRFNSTQLCIFEDMELVGIADLVLVYDDHAEILDYKTDRSRDASFYIEEYAAQLRLYRRAFAQRLAVPVTKLTIYSFTLGEEIDIPLQATQKNL